MKYLISCLIVAIAAANYFGCSSARAESFQPEPGFVSLTNDKDLSGWGYKDAAGKVVPFGATNEASAGLSRTG